MDVRPTWTDCDEAGDQVVPNVFSPRDLVFDLTTWTKLYHTHVPDRFIACGSKRQHNETTKFLNVDTTNKTEYRMDF